MSQVIKTNTIYHFRTDNIARSGDMFKDTKEQARLVELLAAGWNEELGVVSVSKMTEKEQVQAVKLLTNERATLASADLSQDPEKITIGGKSVSITPPEQLAIWDKVYLDKEGAIVVPTYKGGTCFRRAAVLLKTNTVRVKRGLPLIDELPCIVKDYSTAMEQFIDNINENHGKTNGAKRMSAADDISAARRLYRCGADESKVIKAFSLKRGMGQKLFRICKLDKAHKDLKIIDRIVAGDLDPRGLDKEKVESLLKKKADSTEVETFLKAPNAGNNKKIMSRKGIEALEDRNPVKLIKLVCQAILKNDPMILNAVSDKADAVNKAVSEALQ